MFVGTLSFDFERNINTDIDPEVLVHLVSTGTLVLDIHTMFSSKCPSDMKADYFQPEG
jgi:hypothetical protein